MIRSHKELRVWGNAMDAAMEIFEMTKTFPKSETYSLIDQIRRSSRSVPANISEAWRKRRYRAAFVAKLNDAETEATETQTWLEFSLRCGYISEQTACSLDTKYEQITAQLITMINQADRWVIKPTAPTP